MPRRRLQGARRARKRCRTTGEVARRRLRWSIHPGRRRRHSRKFPRRYSSARSPRRLGRARHGHFQRRTKAQHHHAGGEQERPSPSCHSLATSTNAAANKRCCHHRAPLADPRRRRCRFRTCSSGEATMPQPTSRRHSANKSFLNAHRTMEVLDLPDRVPSGIHDYMRGQKTGRWAPETCPYTGMAGRGNSLDRLRRGRPAIPGRRRCGSAGSRARRCCGSSRAWPTGARCPSG